MDDIVGVITSVEDDTDLKGKAYKKVTLGTGQVLKVKQGRDGVLMAKWGLLEVGVAFAFKMAEFKNVETGAKFPYVQDIKRVADELQPLQAPTILPEHQGVIQQARKEAVSATVGTPPKTETAPPNPQAVGMITKEIGDMIRNKYLISIFGEDAGNELIKWYRSQTLGITRIPCDGAKLPSFEKKVD